MQQLVLTQHTGVNLRYPLDMLTDFTLEHGGDCQMKASTYRNRLESIFLPPPRGGGFLVLGVNEALEVIGMLAMENAASTQTGLHRLLSLVVHTDYRGQGHARALMRSGKMFCKDLILLHLDPNSETAKFFYHMGFEATEEALYLERK